MVIFPDVWLEIWPPISRFTGFPVYRSTGLLIFLAYRFLM